MNAGDCVTTSGLVQEGQGMSIWDPPVAAITNAQPCA